MNVKKIIWKTIVIVELLCIIGLVTELIFPTLAIKVDVLHRSSLLFGNYGPIKYFYELKPHTTTTIHLLWKNTHGPNNPVYTINSDGLNQTSNNAIEKKKGVYRIAAIGDSFTFGRNVNTSQNYPSQLSDILNKRYKCGNIAKFEVLNLGVSGYDLQYAEARYEKRGKKYDPDLILWFLIGDDFRRLDEYQIPIMRKYWNEIQKSNNYANYVAKGNYYPDFWKSETDMLRLFGAQNAIRFQESFLNQLRNTGKQPIVLFTFPDTEDIYKNLLTRFSRSTKSVYFYDRIPNIHAINNYILPDSHPSPKGYRAIAENLANYLVSRKIIDCTNSKFSKSH